VYADAGVAAAVELVGKMNALLTACMIETVVYGSSYNTMGTQRQPVNSGQNERDEIYHYCLHHRAPIKSSTAHELNHRRQTKNEIEDPIQRI
jgi:hypothetical protein